MATASSSSQSIKDSLAKLEFLRLQQNLSEIDRSKTHVPLVYSLLSIIIKPGDTAKLAEVKSMLEKKQVIICEEFGKFETVPHTKMGPHADELLEQAKRKLASVTEVPRNGFVYFNGWFVDDEQKEHHYSHTLEPYRPVSSSVFIADYRFHTEPLHAVLNDAAGVAYGFALLDYTGLLISKVHGADNDVVSRVAMQIPKFRSTLQSLTSLYARCADFLRQAFADEKDASKFTVAGLVLAGNDKLHQHLYEALPADLKKLVVKVVNVKSEEEDGLHEAQEAVAEQLGPVRLFQEILLLRDFFRLKQTDPTKVVVGPSATAAAVDSQRAKTLILYEDLLVHRVTDRNKVAYYEEGQPGKEQALAALGEPRHDELLTHYYLTLANKFDIEGLRIELVSRHSRQGTAFWKDVGVAAMLK